MTNKRDDIIETTCQLVETQGYHATGLNQIIRESGAPRGSLYHYFPDGKEELTAQAIEHSGEAVKERIRQALAEQENVAKAVRLFVRRIADLVEASDFRSGGPLMTVAMETATTSERLNHACQVAYNKIVSVFAEALTRSGHTDEEATRLATFITAAIEGGVVLSRTYHSGDPLRQAADMLAQMLTSPLEQENTP